MGNCCGTFFGSRSSGGSASRQSNNLSQQRSRREQNWIATGQISLRDGNLKELPGSLRSVGASARVLDASNNKLVTLSPAVGELVNLQRLILANNLLSSLHYLQPLTRLKLIPEVRTASRLAAGRLSLLPLHKYSLRATEINRSSPGPLHCGGIRCLKLHWPQVLVLDSNRLTQLPPEIGSLSRLERLHCSRNALADLPSCLGELSSLTSFHCSGNKIGVLPAELANASALEEIDASDNYLKGVPESLERLHRLKTLNVNKNQITSIPSAVLRGCSALQTLSLHSNPITAEDLRNVDGFEDFENRRRSKVDKQISGGAAYNLEESVDRVTSNS